MDSSNVLYGCRRWFRKFGRIKCSFSEKLVTDEFEFPNGEDVTITDFGVVTWCVKDSHAAG
jgi:hypothetical protein